MSTAVVKGKSTPDGTAQRVSSKNPPRTSIQPNSATAKGLKIDAGTIRKRATKKSTDSALGFAHAYALNPLEQINLIRKGLDVSSIDAVSQSMGANKEELCKRMGISTSSLSRWTKESKPLSKEASARVLGIQRLIGQVQYMVDHYGENADFSAPRWFNSWSQEPNPALGGARPIEFLDTDVGFDLVSNLLKAMVHGSYQ